MQFKFQGYFSFVTFSAATASWQRRRRSAAAAAGGHRRPAAAFCLLVIFLVKELPGAFRHTPARINIDGTSLFFN